MQNSYRADHIGSLLRPAELVDARRNGANEEHLREIEDREILRILAKQQDAGLNIFTDGELRRRNFMSDFIQAVRGFDTTDAVSRSWDASHGAATPVSSVTGIVTSKLSQVRPLTSHETLFLRAHKPGPIKVTLPSATQFPAISFKRGITDKAYADRSALLWDIVEILKRELRNIKHAAIDYIQIDAPRYNYFIDPKWRNWILTEMGQDPDAVFDEYLRADNACFEAARGSGVTLGIHLCRGNNRSHWYAEGGYDAIAEKMFNTLSVDRFLLEYDDERSGGFEPLRFVPRGKTVVLGLLSTKAPQLESKETLLVRIEQATKYVPLEKAEMIGWLREGVGALVRQAGLQLMGLLMEKEVRQLAGERSQRQAERSANRWGKERGYCLVMGQKVPIERPRVRTTDQEVRLGSYEMFHRGEPLTETVWEKLMLGLSSRKYGQAVREFSEAYGLEKSAVSEHFIEASRTKLKALLERRLEKLRLCALLIDATPFAGQQMIVALGIGYDGRKTILGIRQGATENAT